jgi:hypothetical protein
MHKEHIVCSPRGYTGGRAIVRPVAGSQIRGIQAGPSGRKRSPFEHRARRAFLVKIASIRSAATTTITAPPITYGADGLVMISVTSSFGTVMGTVTLSVNGGAPSSQNLSGRSTVFTLADLTAGVHRVCASCAAQGTSWSAPRPAR